MDKHEPALDATFLAVAELAARFTMSQPTISKHLKMLERALLKELQRPPAASQRTRKRKKR